MKTMKVLLLVYVVVVSEAFQTCKIVVLLRNAYTSNESYHDDQLDDSKISDMMGES